MMYRKWCGITRQSKQMTVWDQALKVEIVVVLYLLDVILYVITYVYYLYWVYSAYATELCPVQNLRAGRFGYQMMPPGRIQTSGFSDADTYCDVIKKGAKGLNITSQPETLSLVVSNGLVTNAPLRDGREWTLGNYTLEIGGVSTRSKKTFGIYSPPKVPDDVSYTAYLHIFYNFILTQFGDNKAKEKESSVTLCSKSSSSKSTSSYLPPTSKYI